MNVSEMIGGVPSITAVLVLMTGLLGFFIGPCVISYLKIQDDIARGVLLGTSAWCRNFLSIRDWFVDRYGFEYFAALVTQLVATVLVQ